MIHLILATHAGLGTAMLKTAEMISGGTDGIRSIELYPGGSPDDIRHGLEKELAGLAEGDHLLCLVDIPGGSPAHAAVTLSVENPSLQVVSGVNLGMLTEAILLRDCMEIQALKTHLVEAAVMTIKDMNALLQEKAG